MFIIVKGMLSSSYIIILFYNTYCTGKISFLYLKKKIIPYNNIIDRNVCFKY